MSRLPVVLAITGASGAPYGVRLLEVLARNDVPVWLLVSSHGWRLLAEECDAGTEDALRTVTGDQWGTVTLFDDRDRGARPASGSVPTAGMVICPCSMGTVSAVAHGTSRSLIERAADVTLKERRPLVIVPRETPLHLGHLRAMTALAEIGAIILPPMVAFYAAPRTLDDVVNHVVGKVLDVLRIEHDLFPRWGEASDG